MENYRKGSDTVHDIKYHLVWITKYRYQILKGDLALRTREIIKEACMVMDIKILKGAVSLDHIHIFVSAPPTLSPSKIIQILKGRSSFKIQQEFPTIRKRYWGQHLWGRGYFCATEGNITDEIIKQYIAGHQRDDEAESFVVADRL